MSDVFPALAFSLLSALLAFGLYMAPADTGEVAIVFPLFTDEATAYAIVGEAGGYVVGPTRFSNIVVAYADDVSFRDRASALGALLFVKADGLCSPLVESFA